MENQQDADEIQNILCKTVEDDLKETQNVFDKIVKGEMQKHPNGYFYISLDLKLREVRFIEWFLHMLLNEGNDIMEDHTHIGFYTPLIYREGAITIMTNLERIIPCEPRRHCSHPIHTLTGKTIQIYCGSLRNARGIIPPTLLFAYKCFGKDGNWKPDAIVNIQRLQSYGNGKNKLIVFTPL